MQLKINAVHTVEGFAVLTPVFGKHPGKFSKCVPYFRFWFIGRIFVLFSGYDESNSLAHKYKLWSYDIPVCSL